MTDLSAYELSQLIAACRRQERAAQRALYARYYSYGLTVCLHYARHREEAEEIVHDAFVKVFQKIGQLKEPGVFRSWFRQILVRVAIDHFRRRAQQPATHGEEVPDDYAFVENQAHLWLEKEDVIYLLQGLSARYRLVFNLFVMEGYTHEEIAKALHISIGSSKSNLSRAKQQLRKLLEKNDFFEAGHENHANS